MDIVDKIVKAVRPEEIIEARFNLTSKENDIIDMVLNIINDDGKYVYNFDIKTYTKLYEDGKTNIYRDLKKATNDLFKKHNEFYVKDKETGQEIGFVWFSMLKYNDKEGTIKFEVGQTLKEILLNMKSKIFYELKYSLNLKSIYSKRMYYYLKRFDDTGFRVDKIEDLLSKLECPESYKEFKYFKRRVLEVAKEEINIYSDIEFDYTPIKKGTKVIRLYFTIKCKDIAEEEVAATLEKFKKKNTFNNFNQRTYNFEELEKGLLGWDK